MKYTKIISILIAAAVFAIALPASAESETSQWLKNFSHERPGIMRGPQGMRPEGPRFGQDGTSTERMMRPNASSTKPMMKPALMGKVATINGSTFTITSMMERREGGTTTPAVTFTVDASNATVIKAGATSTVASIATGDYVLVLGTVSGTNIVAKTIVDGMPRKDEPKKEKVEKLKKLEKPTLPTGNGKPVVLGTVASISGSSLTITNNGGAQYTVDASNAVVRKGNATSTVSAIVVGDSVIVQGSVSGSSITASTIISRPTTPANDNSSSDRGENPPRRSGFFGSVGGFISNMFGF